MKISIIIPARMASTRLPKKPLADIMGKSLIEHVYLKATQVKEAEVIIATDDQLIFDHVQQFGGRAMMTSTNHPSGTDRIAEVAQNIESDIIINLQGDEPLINPKQIEALIELMKNPLVKIGTQCAKIKDVETLFDYNIVKVVRDINDKALYFSRQAIPAIRDQKFEKWIAYADYYKHIGIYGFKRMTLLELCTLPQTTFEKSESLEQLRWLQHGYDVFCQETLYTSIGVDTPEDLDRVRDYILKEMFH